MLQNVPHSKSISHISQNILWIKCKWTLERNKYFFICTENSSLFKDQKLKRRLFDQNILFFTEILLKILISYMIQELNSPILSLFPMKQGQYICITQLFLLSLFFSFIFLFLISGDTRN